MAMPATVVEYLRSGQAIYRVAAKVEKIISKVGCDMQSDTALVS